jgi:hypothetical protein
MQVAIKHILVGLIVCAALAAEGARAGERESASAEKPTPPTNSLDDELLKSLGDAPAKPDQKPATKPAESPAKKPDAEHKSDTPLDEALHKSLADDPNEGEDIGETQFTKVAREMRAVQEKLAQHNSDAATQAQQKQIAAELAALLDQMRKQCSGSKSGSKSPSGSSKPGGQKGGNTPASDASNQPARDSSPEVRPNQGVHPDPAATRELLKKSPDWLKLPEKEREQMLQNAADEFLPNYEFSIKKYFERIIEDEK